MNRKQARQLIEQYLQGHCTPEEEAMVERWLAELEEDTSQPAIPDERIEHTRKQTLAKLLERLESADVPLTTRRSIMRYWPYAAAAILLVAIGIYRGGDNGQSDTRQLSAYEIGPGSEKAVLTTASGTTIHLDSTRQGITMEGTAIRYADGTDVLPSGSAAADESVQQYTLSTPVGGTYQVTLSDGTRVWLNAGSTLTYPDRFTGTRREVRMDGEAYFEVNAIQSSDQQFVPFVVKTGEQSITVLGTSFNVRKYPEEALIATTLVTGRVKVSDAGGTNTVILEPGEQARYTPESLTKQKANLYSAIAWKSGRFNFDGMDLKSVMAELARWYDIAVTYEGEVPELEFFGGVYRNNNLATVLKILESNHIGYRLEPGPTLIISQSAPHNNQIINPK